MSDLSIAYTNGAPAPTLNAATSTLVSVPQQPLTPPTHLPRGLGRFEGAQVGQVEIKISGLCAIDAGDTTVSLDDMVRAVGVYRVTKVLHYVHPKTGETVRQQILTPVESLVLTPWDSTNPMDCGIVRARP